MYVHEIIKIGQAGVLMVWKSVLPNDICTFNLFKKVKDNNLNVETTLSLFDTYVSSVLH